MAKSVATFVAGLLVGVLGLLGYQGVSDKVAGLIGGDDPLDYVTIVDPSRPIQVFPAEVIKRLDFETGVAWHVGLWQDGDRAYYGGEPLRSNASVLRRLDQQVTLPGLDDKTVKGLATNALDTASVRANGTYYLIWFSQSPNTYDWLASDPTIFADEQTDKRRKTYDIGELVIYYSPPEHGRDWTPELDTYVKHVLVCPTNHAPCSADGSTPAAG